MNPNHEMSNKVDNARIAIKVLSIIALIIGLLYTLVMFFEDPTLGIIIAGAGISGLATCGLIRGLYTMTYAAEIYIHQNKTESTGKQE